MAAQFDDAIANLESFIALATESCERLDESTARIGSAGSELGSLEGEAEGKLGAWNDALDGDLSELTQAVEDTRGAIDDLGEAAEAAAGTRLGAVESGLDQAESEAEQQLRSAGEEMDGDFARLLSDGFQGHAAAVDEVEGELAARTGEDQQARQGFESGLDQIETAVDQARTEIDGAFQEGETEAAATADEVESAFGAITAEWAQTIDQQLAQGCEEVGRELGGEYDDWAGKAAQRADELVQAVEELARESAQFVGEESAQALEQQVEESLEQSGGALDGELGRVEAALDESVDVAEPLSPLAADLDRSLQVVEQVRQLLEQMG